MGLVPIQVLKEFEHQARQDLSAAFSQVISKCNLFMESCRDSIKAIIKVKKESKKVPILKRQPEMVMKKPATIWIS